MESRIFELHSIEQYGTVRLGAFCPAAVDHHSPDWGNSILPGNLLAYLSC